MSSSRDPTNHSPSAILYKSLGIGSHTILALAAVYGTVAFLSNAITTKYMTDQWGRRKYVLPLHYIKLFTHENPTNITLE